MTLKDFKTYLLISIKKAIDDQRTQSMLMLLTMGSLISKEVGEQAQRVGEQAQAHSEDLEYQLELMHGMITGEPIVNNPAEYAPAPRRSRPVSEDEKAQKRLQVAQKIDIAMAKLTGVPTGAPWSVVNAANLETASAGDLVSQVNRMPVGPGG